MSADAYLVALTRISGIVGGVFVMLLLSVIIFPKSASHQVCPMTNKLTDSALACHIGPSMACKPFPFTVLTPCLVPCLTTLNDICLCQVSALSCLIRPNLSCEPHD